MAKKSSAKTKKSTKKTSGAFRRMRKLDVDQLLEGPLCCFDNMKILTRSLYLNLYLYGLLFITYSLLE